MMTAAKRFGLYSALRACIAIVFKSRSHARLHVATMFCSVGLMPDGFSDGSQAIAAVEVPASACDDDASWPLSAEVEASADAMWPRQGPRRAAPRVLRLWGLDERKPRRDGVLTRTTSEGRNGRRSK